MVGGMCKEIAATNRQPIKIKIKDDMANTLLLPPRVSYERMTNKTCNI